VLLIAITTVVFFLAAYALVVGFGGLYALRSGGPSAEVLSRGVTED